MMKIEINSDLMLRLIRKHFENETEVYCFDVTNFNENKAEYVAHIDLIDALIKFFNVKNEDIKFRSSDAYKHLDVNVTFDENCKADFYENLKNNAENIVRELMKNSVLKGYKRAISSCKYS